MLPRLAGAVLLPMLIFSGASCAARYQGRVTLEDSYEPEPTVSNATATGPSRATRPPDCSGDLPMPEYPVDLLGPGAPEVKVRVDLLLNDEGVPEEVTARLQPPSASSRAPFEPEQDTPAAAAFLRAAEDAVSLWRCRPAWRHPLPDEPPAWVPLPYRTWLLFHFDAERVDRKAALAGKGGGDTSAGR